jgi:dimeric dUTPase (all-alpha-NTP-PPase superfamily)
VKQELITMLTLQDDMNRRVHPDWRAQGYDWYRAIWIESAELMDHYGWKWWKKQDRDIAQVELELVDIWHFGLSDLLTREPDLNAIADRLVPILSSARSDGNFPAQLEAFTLAVLQTQAFDAQHFAQLLACLEMPFAQLFRSYVGKNVLNFFRQDHGYKIGTYLKVWDGREDNEHLVEVIAELDSTSEKFQEHLYLGLKRRYPGELESR